METVRKNFLKRTHINDRIENDRIGHVRTVKTGIA